MNYELAKKLKEKGFPQKSYFQTLCPCDSIEWKGESFIRDCTHGTNTKAYRPTLEELIEACPKEVKDSDNPTAKFNLTWNGDEWVACLHYYDDYAEPIGTGSTPEEAVANLWLELNKK